ncbi:MAG: hypothetical protein Q8P56_06570 [Candidatus Uhrbacteria bacterium]|nr:hypothetical protein [Candidatus Uhrbacteria bacterium]
MNLRQTLIAEDKTAWLDIGCNKNFEPGFTCLDRWPKSSIPSAQRKSYIQFDIASGSRADWKRLGKYHLVRMQHVLEHFEYESGIRLIKNIGDILEPKGFLLITVPDLQIFIQRYQSSTFTKWKLFSQWAQKRIPKDAPPSFYFSIFTHSLPKTPHKWCYDFAGVRYILQKTRQYSSIKLLPLSNRLSSIPFTHNRPEEDLCVLAQK